MSVRDAAGAPCRGPRGVGGPDDPVPAPGDDEEHGLLGAHDEAGLRADPVARHDQVDALGRLHVQRPASPAISWISSVQTPAALTTTRARIPRSLPSSRSRARTPTTARPRGGSRFTRVATRAPWAAAVRAMSRTRRASSTPSGPSTGSPRRSCWCRSPARCCTPRRVRCRWCRARSCHRPGGPGAEHRHRVVDGHPGADVRRSQPTCVSG